MLERYFRPFEAGRGLQEQLRESLLSAILDGAMPPGEPMPSSRKLCELLNVSRNTVVLVYEQLVQDGYLIPSDRRGFFINEKYLRQQLNVSLKPATQNLRAPRPCTGLGGAPAKQFVAVAGHRQAAQLA